MVVNFGVSTQLRNFELVLDDGSLFVNPYYLAEISPYFNRLCFANFRETEQNYVKMQGISVEDMQELLRCVCPDENFTLDYRITADNFAALIYLSDRLLLQNLRRELERLAAEKDAPMLGADTAPMNNLVEILVEALQAEFSDASQREICRRIGRFCEDEVLKFVDDSFEPEISAPLREKLQPFFYQPPRRYDSGITYNWNQMHMRLFF